MNERRDRYYRTLKSLDTFTDRALELAPYGPHLSGFHYTRELLRAAMANTYIETVGERADSLHLAIKNVPASNIYWAYRNTVEILGKRANLMDHEAVLAFDYTDENFYGDVQGFWIHGWNGEHAVTGKFKFLTCAIVSSEIPERIPLISIPIRVGHNMAKEVCWCIAVVQSLLRSINLILFDRGFYSKELMLSMTKADYPYLILVSKNSKVQTELALMTENEKKKIHYEFKVNKDKTVFRGETTLALLKQILDPKNKKRYDWAFATNQTSINLDYIVPTYKGRWRIETGFRVQDEARIKSRSKNARIRFFYFAYEQVLQLAWMILYKEEVPFKKFLLDMDELCLERNRRTK